MDAVLGTWADDIHRDCSRTVTLANHTVYSLYLQTPPSQTLKPNYYPLVFWALGILRVEPKYLYSYNDQVHATRTLKPHPGLGTLNIIRQDWRQYLGDQSCAESYLSFFDDELGRYNFEYFDLMANYVCQQTLDLTVLDMIPIVYLAIGIHLSLPELYLDGLAFAASAWALGPVRPAEQVGEEEEFIDSEDQNNVLIELFTSLVQYIELHPQKTGHDDYYDLALANFLSVLLNEGLLPPEKTAAYIRALKIKVSTRVGGNNKEQNKESMKTWRDIATTVQAHIPTKKDNESEMLTVALASMRDFGSRVFQDESYFLPAAYTLLGCKYSI